MKLNMMWIVLCNIGMVNAELLIMPVTLSAITKLAPRKFTSSLIGVYYVTFSIGSIFAGLFASAFPDNNPTKLLNMIPIGNLPTFFLILSVFSNNSLILSFFNIIIVFHDICNDKVILME